MAEHVLHDHHRLLTSLIEKSSHHREAKARRGGKPEVITSLEPGRPHLNANATQGKSKLISLQYLSFVKHSFMQILN
jgi:hypothetical protein